MYYCGVYNLIIISLLSSHSFAIEFITEPPLMVKTFQGQNITLPCVLRNLIPNYHTVQWVQIESYASRNNISNNRNVLIQNIENFGHFAILGDDLNFTLLVNIVTEFENDNNIVKHNVGCFVTDPYVNKVVLSSISEIIIQKWNFIAPACGPIMAYYVIGQTLQLLCYHDSDPTIITTLKSGRGEVLPTKSNGLFIIHNLIVTKKDHGATYKFESSKNGTNEMRSCSIGPITVNYKPEINITQISATEFHCTAKARPPVNVTLWIVDSSIPEDSFTISNDILRIMKPLKDNSEVKIICKAENSIGKNAQTLIVPTDNQDEEDENDMKQDDGNKINQVVVILVSVIFCFALVGSFYLYKFKQCKILKTGNDNTIVDQSLHTQEDGYQVPIKTVREHHQSLKVTESKEDEKAVGYDNVSPNKEGQSLEVTSSSPTYVNTQGKKKKIEYDKNSHHLEDDNKNDTEYQTIPDVTLKVKGEEVTYVNNPRVKKCHSTNITNND